MRICAHNTCDKKHDSHGYCANHARQFKRWGRIRTKAEISEEISKRNSANSYVLGKTWKIKDTSKMKGHHPKSEFKKGLTPWNRGTKGLVGAWNKGKRLSPEHIEKLRQANLGRIPWNKVGDGITPRDKIDRDRFRKTVHKNILKRDDYICQVCDIGGGYLHVDHIKSWSKYPELRFEESNCRTLCRACHYYVTFKKKMPNGSNWGVFNMTKKEGY